MIDLQQNNKVSRLTFNDDKEHSVAWSHDGSALYFIAGRSGTSQVWRLPVTGGEAQQITDLPLDVDGFLVAEDNSKIVLQMAAKPGCETLSCTVEAKQIKAGQQDSAMVYDQLMVRHWDTWADEFRSHLYIADLTGKKVTDAKDLLPEWNTDIAGIKEVSFTPDGKIWYSARKFQVSIKPGIPTLIFFRYRLKVAKKSI